MKSGCRCDGEHQADSLLCEVPEAAEAVPAGYVIPAGRQKLVLAIGSRKTGKSTLLRWIAERATEREGTVLATLALNRTLKHYFPETVHPEGNSISNEVAFLEMFLDVTTENKMNAVLDFPGDDTVLLHLLDQGVDPAGIMAEAGVELMALYHCRRAWKTSRPWRS